MRGCCNQPLGLQLKPAHFNPDLIKLSAGVLPRTHTDVSRLSTDGDGDSKHPGSLSTLPRVEVRVSPSRGFGLFAVDPIPAYTKILEDDALISLAPGEDLPQLWEKYCLLPSEQKQVFDELGFPSQLAAREQTMISKLEQRGYESFVTQNMARVNSRWQANAFKTGAATLGAAEPHTWSYALFGTVARINHSCTPNASAHYRPAATEVVYALRDIPPGEEIEISYFDMTMSFLDRQARAQAWGFQCSCPACSKIGKFAHPEYEQRLSYVHRNLSLDYSSFDPGRMRDSVQTAISWAQSSEYPSLVIALPRLFISLFNLEIQLGQTNAKAREALAKTLEWEEKTTGPDSPSSQERRRVLMDFDAAVESLSVSHS